MIPQPESYKLKRVDFNSHNVAIVLQNVNGACPLIAVANILLLRGQLILHEDMAAIGADELLSRVGEYLLDVKMDVSDQYRANHEMNVNDVIQMLPSTQRGIDVNVQFKSITGFEFTSECMLFDFCNARLVHGWLPDPQDTELYSFIQLMSYNQLVEKQIAYQMLMQDLAKKLDSFQIADKNQPSLDTNLSDNEASVITKEGLLAERYLSDTASQLTYHGLSELHSGLKDEELCVFFRNNHFSTLYKHNGELVLLATDQGYAKEPLVWEKLNQIDGDSIFLRSDFTRYEATSPSISHILGATVTDDGFIIEEDAVAQNTDNDLALALQMQQEEDARGQHNTPQVHNDAHQKPEAHKKKHKHDCTIQ